MLPACVVSYSCSLDSHVVLGTVLLWVGWLGFNAGSTFAANLKAGMAAFNTNLAGSVGSVAKSSTLWSCLADRAETVCITVDLLG
jgi:ammonia channel protein AmtB